MQLRAADESEKDLTYKLWNDRQGYSAGEIRGGVSVIIPMKEALEDYDSSLTVAALSHVGIWLVGMIFLFIGQKKLTAGWQAEREAQNELQMNIDQSREFIKSALDSLDGHVAFLKIDIGMILQLKQMLFTDKLFFIKNFSY